MISSASIQSQQQIFIKVGSITRMQFGLTKLLVIWSLITVLLAVIPQYVWTYVPDDTQLTTLQKLCLQNIQNYAQKSGYRFQLLTNSNYTSVLSDKQQIQSILQNSQIDSSISLPDLIQLSVLIQQGGIWIDKSTFLVETLQWLNTLKNQKFINNRIDSPEVVMFYQPSWFEQTHKVTHPKIQNLVVAPYFKTWFIAAQKDSTYLKDFKALYIYAIKNTYQSNVQSFSGAGHEVVDYLLDESRFFDWLASLTLQIEQKQLDKQKNASRKLAISEYKITGIDLLQSAKVVDQAANNHVDLACKYLTQITIGELDLNLHYLVRLDKEVIFQLYQTLEREYVNLQRFHSAGDLLCDQVVIPLRYVVNNSVIGKYLIEGTNQSVILYDSEYIRHHCEGTFIEVYTLIFTKYLLPIIAICLNCFLARKAILILQPEQGFSSRQTFKNQEGGTN